MATLAGQPPPDAARGAQAARVGAVVGLVSAVAPVALRLISSESPEASARVPGTVAFTLVYASPSLLALMASSVQSPGVRGGLLAAIVGLLALGAGFSIPSSVALLLLPPTFVLWFAAARSLAAARHPLRTSLPAVVVGLLIAAPAGFGFIALFAVQDDELRCWVASDAVSFCASDVVTTTEAGLSIGAVALSLLGMLFVSLLRWARDDDVVRTGSP